MKLVKVQDYPKLYCGDCEEVLKNIPDGSVDLVIIDPPYNVAINSGGSVNTVKKLNVSLQDLKTSKLDEGYDIEKVNRVLIRKMKEINIYIFCSKAQIMEYLNLYVNELGCTFDILFWQKPNALPTYSNKYLTDCEYVLYFRKGKGKCFPQSYEDAKSIYIAPINHKDKKLYGHPTVKPLPLVEKFIRNSSREGQVVLDAYMGSGTVGVACKKLNRKFIGIEIDRDFFVLSKERIAGGEQHERS